MDSRNNFVLCQPRGGITDKLTQMELCATYCEESGRVLIIDTDHDEHTFRDEFSNYFSSSNARIILNAANLKKEFNDVSIYPKMLQGKVGCYTTRYDRAKKLTVESESGEITSFDFNFRAYQERVLVHNQAGGNPLEALKFLRRLKLSPWLANELHLRLESIGGFFAAVHIRNTDINTDYEKAIKWLSDKNFNKLFIATDDVKVQDRFIKEFGSKISYFTDLYNINSDSLHYFSDKRLAKERNKDAILDLLTLACAHELYIFKANNYYTEYSGFSKLALLLKNDKDILNNLLSP